MPPHYAAYCGLQRVKFIVGGLNFHTSTKTINKDPHSKLADLVAHDPPDEDGRYHLDRDPKLFGYLLNFLRDGIVEIPEERRCLVKAEASFFGLSRMVNWMSVFPPPELMLETLLVACCGSVDNASFYESKWLHNNWGKSFSITLQFRLEECISSKVTLLSAGTSHGEHRPLLGLLPEGYVVAYPPFSTCRDPPAQPLQTKPWTVTPKEWVPVCYVFDECKNYVVLHIDQDSWYQKLPSDCGPGTGSVEGLFSGLILSEGEESVVLDSLIGQFQNICLHHKALPHEEALCLIDEARDDPEQGCDFAELMHKPQRGMVPAQQTDVNTLDQSSFED